MNTRKRIITLVLAGGLAVPSIPSFAAQGIPRGFAEVRPVTRAAGEAAGANLTLASTRFFTYALPQGWRVGEDGQFALSLMAPDSRALTVLVGNAGVLAGSPTATVASTVPPKSLVQ